VTCGFNAGHSEKAQSPQRKEISKAFFGEDTEACKHAFEVAENDSFSLSSDCDCNPLRSQNLELWTSKKSQYSRCKEEYNPSSNQNGQTAKTSNNR